MGVIGFEKPEAFCDTLSGTRQQLSVKRIATAGNISFRFSKERTDLFRGGIKKRWHTDCTTDRWEHRVFLKGTTAFLGTNTGAQLSLRMAFS